ncbi:MAG: hypothetical protein HGA66_10245 [Holophaga sp.]|nr:hypothetical protein [Holophaga sp.]
MNPSKWCGGSSRLARFARRVLLAAGLLLAGGQASAYTYAVRNTTPFTLMVSLDYHGASRISCRPDNDKQIRPGGEGVFRSGACMIRLVTVSIHGEPRFGPANFKMYRWSGGYAGDMVWTVRWDAINERLTCLTSSKSLFEIMNDGTASAARSIGDWIEARGIDLLDWAESFQSMCECSKPAVPFRKAPGGEFQILTLNAYCFPRATVDTLRALRTIGSWFTAKAGETVPDLQAGITKGARQRIREMAGFVRMKDPDVAFFQELWSDENKIAMIQELCATHPYCLYIPRQVPLVSMARLDDGILIVSKTPFAFSASITYRDHSGEENMARKGALFVGMKDREGNPLLLVNTHLQSGTPPEEVQIRRKQMLAVAREIGVLKGKMPAFRDARVVVGGDLNEPTMWNPELKHLVDRSDSLARALQEGGVDVTNDQLLKQAALRLGAGEIITVNEMQRASTIRDLDMNPKRMAGVDLAIYAARAGSWIGKPFPEATDPASYQILDHLFLDRRLQLKSFQVFRQEILGAPGALKGSSLPTGAISDHAAFMVTLGRK